MKIGIITFHASFNYGSMLQAWALQTFLKKRGHDVKIINYRSLVQKRIYHKPICFNSVINILSTIKRLLLYPSSIPLLIKKWNLFNFFLHKELILTEEFNTLDELDKANLDCDVLICGSDQIWNCSAPDATDAYYGNFVEMSVSKIAYAVSMGQTPEDNSILYYKQQIKNFNAISVRESRVKDIIVNNKIYDDVQIVCDPTLLLHEYDYQLLLNENIPLIDEPYMFFYTPVGLPTKYFEIASHIAKENGLKLITEKAYYPYQINRYGIEQYLPVGPKEFLNLIKNAEIVIGGSFHLLVFSILFKKEFYCINGDKDSRTNSLLKRLDLTSRIISLKKPTEYDKRKISYSGIEVKLDDFRNSSTEWLISQLSKVF